jgi:hypothetical protein
VVAGLVAAVVLFGWSEWRTGRLAADMPLSVPSNAATALALAPTAVVAVPTALAVVPTAVAAVPTAFSTLPTVVADAPGRVAGEATRLAGGIASEPTRAPTSTPVPPTRAPVPTAMRAPVASAPTGREVSISRDELDGELKRSLADGGAPLRNPRLGFVPSDRVTLAGEVPVAIFQVPVQIEARLFVEGGQVKVSTTKVEAVGASLPGEMARTIGQRVDDQGTQAVAGALPPGATARRVVVEADRIRVELA